MNKKYKIGKFPFLANSRAKAIDVPEGFVKILADSNGNARPLAGGTDLIVQLRVKDPRVNAETVVDIKKIPELNQMDYDKSGGLTIGAAVPLHLIYNNPDVIKHFPAIIDSASLIGGTPIQGRATLGGNLCNGAPSGDSIPNLVAHNVVATVAGPNGTREIPVEDVCTGPRQTSIDSNELLVSLYFPNPGDLSLIHISEPTRPERSGVCGVGV